VNTGATSLALAGSNAIALTGTIAGTGNIRAATGIADLTQQSAATMLNTGTVEMNSGGQVWVSSASNLGSNTSILFSGSVPSTLVAKGDTGVITQNMYLGSLTGVTASVDTGGYTVTLGGTLADLTSGVSSVFEKSGAGTLILSANNTYARDTTVSAGTLLVNGGLYNGAAAGTTTVAAGAILGGSGSIARAVNVNGTLKGHGTQFTGPVTILGGTHSPGNSPGSQTFTNGLTYSGSSTLEWELIANGTTGAGTTFDFIALTGGTMTIGAGAAMQLVFNSGGSTVNWNDAIWNASNSWTVIDATGALFSSGNFSLLGSPSTWVDSNSLSLASAMAPNNRTTSTFTVDNSTGSIVLNYSAIIVPEPAAIGLVALGTFGLVLVRRRKRA
jgi:autotransporter-associated beta strand protein